MGIWAYGSKSSIKSKGLALTGCIHNKFIWSLESLLKYVGHFLKTFSKEKKNYCGDDCVFTAKPLFLHATPLCKNALLLQSIKRC